MIALRLDQNGRVHYAKGMPYSSPQFLASRLGARDGDVIITVQEGIASASVEHFLAVMPQNVELVKQSDAPLEVR